MDKPVFNDYSSLWSHDGLFPEELDFIGKGINQVQVHRHAHFNMVKITFQLHGGPSEEVVLEANACGHHHAWVSVVLFDICGKVMPTFPYKIVTGVMQVKGCVVDRLSSSGLCTEMSCKVQGLRFCFSDGSEVTMCAWSQCNPLMFCGDRMIPEYLRFKKSIQCDPLDLLDTCEAIQMTFAFSQDEEMELAAQNEQATFLIAGPKMREARERACKDFKVAAEEEAAIFKEIGFLPPDFLVYGLAPDFFSDASGMQAMGPTPGHFVAKYVRELVSQFEETTCRLTLASQELETVGAFGVENLLSMDPLLLYSKALNRATMLLTSLKEWMVDPKSARALTVAIIEGARGKWQELVSGTFDRTSIAQVILQHDVGRKIAIPAMLASLRTDSSTAVFPRVDRSAHTLLVIGPGFRIRSDPRQIEALRAAGWALHECFAADPNDASFEMDSAVSLVQRAVLEHKPAAILAASRSGAYLLELWKLGYKVPSVMINIHPECKTLPSHVAVVLCHGLCDYEFHRSDVTLEKLRRCSDAQRHVIYLAAEDGHNMESLLTDELLSRLIEASIAASCSSDAVAPDFYLVRSWSSFLSDERREAECYLGYSPLDRRRFWDFSQPARGDCLVDVGRASKEFDAVSDIFLAKATSKRTHNQSFHHWNRSCIRRVQRVQNAAQLDSLQARCDAFRHQLQVLQSLPFCSEVHMRWLFHGCGNIEALDSIVNSWDGGGFNPLLSGSSVGQVWGAGIYFARDARYAAQAHLAARLPSGEKQILLCLVAIGMPCAGSSSQVGSNVLLPFRQTKHRFNSTVNDMSSPEIFVVQSGSQALPSYVITFV